MRTRHQKLPSAGAEREALRRKGQFWTPDWVAEAMVAYVLAGGSDHVFDPAVGAGAFFRAAKKVAAESRRRVALKGIEIDSEALEEARGNGLSNEDLSQVHVRDFVLCPPATKFAAIVANPPYIRHHRLLSHVKTELKTFGASLIGAALDGRAGLHVYFLLRALQLLEKDGRLAFILPADTCEGVFASDLWNWVAQHYRLDAVITFTPGASPFPGVDTNAVIFLIRNSEPAEKFLWARCDRAQTEHLKTWTTSNLEVAGDALKVYRRELSEALTTGLSRAPVKKQNSGPVLADFARVMRGIATGANEFFFLTAGRAAELGIADVFLLPAIGRTRDIEGDEINSSTIESLVKKGRPTMLLSLDGRPLHAFPPRVREYLKSGEAQGIHQRVLIATRRPWYKMETRPATPFLFAYLGRRNARFIRNRTGVMPLTGFLCVYPHQEDAKFVEQLWQALRHPETIANLALVGKSYGSGAIKVEPRALERLPLSPSALALSGLCSSGSKAKTGKRAEQPFLPLG